MSPRQGTSKEWVRTNPNPHGLGLHLKDAHSCSALTSWPNQRFWYSGKGYLQHSMKQPVLWSLLQPQPCVSPAIPVHLLQTGAPGASGTGLKVRPTPTMEGYHDSGMRRDSGGFSPRSLSLLLFPIPSGPHTARSPRVLGTEPPSHDGLRWPQLVATSATGPACPVVAFSELAGWFTGRRYCFS